MAVRGGLEQTIVQDVPQRFGEGAQDLLLGLPHRGIRVEPQTFLQETPEGAQLDVQRASVNWERLEEDKVRRFMVNILPHYI